MKAIKVYFQTVSPESAENGDFSAMGEHDFREVESIEDALEFIKEFGYLEPSSSEFHSEIWYTTTDSVENYKTGDQTNYTIHLENFSDLEQRQVYKSIIGTK